MLHTRLAIVHLGLFIGALFSNDCDAATTYSYAINDKGWSGDSSVFECRMQHTVPYYGDVIFRTRAGERSAFFLGAKTSRFQAGTARIVSRAPVWKQPMSKELLGEVPIKKGRRPLWLDTQWTELMLANLNNGMELNIEQLTWYDKKGAAPSSVSISSIGFRSVYTEYLECLAGLLPANYDQLKRTALYFAPGFTDKLSRKITRKLDKILQLAVHDKEIKAFYIDGHADSNGDRSENLELSKTRAELIADYLKDRGVPEDWITMRWHGERYPIASNGTKSGRAKNRRVTVRIQKKTTPDVLPIGK